MAGARPGGSRSREAGPRETGAKEVPDDPSESADQGHDTRNMLLTASGLQGSPHRRTVADIQREVAERGKQNVFSPRFRAKDDKDDRRLEIVPHKVLWVCNARSVA